ncbi:hypothetical protein [Burkholderia cepacia]|uniref:hypothetical protein n=1 Tax=Burkholderia cepacia TaxID=292 RepID=UPI00158C0001|nr:hypothetical protein [Burkholderia cepacia]
MRFAIAAFAVVSFGAMLTAANVSDLARRPADELTTMALYWSYLLLPAALFPAASAMGLLGKAEVALLLVVQCLLCVCFAWCAIAEENQWVWVEYWPACVACLVLAVLAYRARGRSSQK